MQILSSFRNIFKIQELKKRIFWTLFFLVVYRFGAHIALPGINPEAIKQFQKDAENVLGGLFHMMQMFSGSALGNLALFSLGIMPYITSSIIMQLMTKVSPTLEAVAKEGPSGQRKINQYTRYLTIPICLIQAVFAVRSLMSMQGRSPVMYQTGFLWQFQMVVALMAGALFVMWLGEQITEHGVGNGASILIMAGIVARLPAVGVQLFTDAQKGSSGVSMDAAVIIFIVYLGVIAAVVFVTQAQRRIPVQHAKHFRGRRVMMGSRNYLPLRVNTAGVMPVIFASSLLVLPQMLGQIKGLDWMRDFFGRGLFFYSVFYIVMIFFFSYFWTYLFFQPVEMANNLKEYGSFIPGIRPGENTANYINTILSRITLCGAAFLAVIALMPDLISSALNVQRYLVAFLGGTGILIVVGVGLDIIQKIESYLLMHHYEGFVGAGGIRGRRG